VPLSGRRQSLRELDTAGDVKPVVCAAMTNDRFGVDDMTVGLLLAVARSMCWYAGGWTGLGDESGRNFMRAWIAVAALALAACAPQAAKHAAVTPPAPKLITEAEALAVIDTRRPLMIARDVAGIVALYADNAVLVDMTAPDLITTKAGNVAATASFVDKGIAKLMINVRQVQILDANTFVSTEIATVEMKPGLKPAGGTARVTDVYQKQANGSWLIANEHVSLMPSPPKTPLPVIVSFPK